MRVQTQTRWNAGPATVPSRRVAAPSWRDPRLLVGVVLVLASVVVGTVTVSAARATTGVWAVTSPVGAGVALTPSDVHVVQVRLDDANLAGYVPATEAVDVGRVTLRGVGAGELLPRSALGSSVDLTDRPVTLRLTGAVPAGVQEGALADVWVTWPAPTAATVTDRSSRPAPELLVQAAEVSTVTGPGTGLSARSGADVQVLVPVGALPEVLQALALEARVDLVPVPGSGTAARS